MEILKYSSTGYLVELVQSILKKLNIYTGNIDGIFGIQTQTSIINFQKQNNLLVDGIVGQNTWDLLYPYIYGFKKYIIKRGDTLYNLANANNITVSQLLFANPNINPDNLIVGSEITIPFGNIVPTDISYVYNILEMNIYSLKQVYPFIFVGSIGKSVMGKEVPYLRIGKGKKEVFYSASIHGNEWITTVVLMKFIEDYAKAYVNNESLFNKNIREIYEDTTIYIVPMINPDGVDLVNNNINKNSNAFRNAQVIANDFPDIPFPSGWKANILGVDLNLQFPANWEQAKQINFEQGYTKPAPRQYVGIAPLTQIEAINLYNFTLKHRFRLVLAYHSQGEVIYWQYLDYVIPDAEQIGNEFANASGYTLAETPYESSFAGYKDWFIKTFRRPGYTLEVGSGTNPLPISQFDEIYSKNIGILILGAIL